MAKSVEKKILVKQALQQKCLRLAALAGSQPKRIKWMYDARRYGAQVAAMTQKLEFEAKQK